MNLLDVHRSPGSSPLASKKLNWSVGRENQGDDFLKLLYNNSHQSHPAWPVVKGDGILLALTQGHQPLRADGLFLLDKTPVARKS